MKLDGEPTVGWCGIQTRGMYPVFFPVECFPELWEARREIEKLKKETEEIVKLRKEDARKEDEIETWRRVARELVRDQTCVKMYDQGK